jgi:hypothetical protein
MVNMQAAQPQVSPPPPRDRLGDFRRTKAATFSHVMESMDANDWLKSIEKMLLASHQLSGPATDWWDAYVEAHEEPESIN